MADRDNLISDISYTNKDFQSVYTELLDLTSKLTDKWAPSMSNESDPGVILLKLNALVADKNNYNIDKNILEAFPVSVTQEKNARNLFEQLGYNMHWYRSATTTVNISWIGEEENSDSYYKIPRFTMLCNDDGTIVYTLLDDCYITPAGTMYNGYVSDKSITTSANVMEGVVSEYQVDGNTTVTLMNLDENHRLYFDTNLIAENGIFINNIKDDGSDIANYDEWRRVDNLSVEKLGSRFYKFDVDNRNQCYIEFPADIDSLIGSGVRIHYLSSAGDGGNIKANTITKFYTDVKDETYNITLNSDNTMITNGSSTQNGRDPESIEEAYANYKKTIGTFKTLVTLRDYQNAINTSGIVSNSFVTDRTDDIQDSYSIVTANNDLQGRKLIVETSGGTPKMDAFSLKMYLLNWVDTIYDKQTYNKSFTMVNTLRPMSDVINYIDSVKSIQHDFCDLESGKLLMVKNKYPVTVKIIPQYTISEQQAQEIEANVRFALYNRYCSKGIQFGEEITYDEIYNTIMSADGRIKAIVLDELVFTTYGIVYDPEELNPNNRFKEILISSTDPTYVDLSNEIRTDIYAKSVLNGNTQLLKQDGVVDYGLNQSYVNLSGQEQVDTPVLDEITSVSTETVIDITFGTEDYAEYNLRDNEKIIFYAPNLIDDITYSNYIKYEYAFDGLDNEHYIPANTDYGMAAGEKIVFYFKEEDDEDVPYSYVVIEKVSSDTPIIKTSFNLRPTCDGIGNMIGKNLHGSGTTPANMQERIADINTDLGAKRIVTTRKFNRETIDKTINRCYWILNNKKSDLVGDYYELFTPENTDYILKSGEYFIFSNDTKTALEIFGQGTKLSLTGIAMFDKPWKVYVNNTTINNISSDGINAFGDSDWFVFYGANAQVTAEEMQFFTLLDGDYVKFIKDSDSATDFQITNEPANIDLNDYIVEYASKASSSRGILPKSIIDGVSWEVISNLGIRLSTEEPQTLLPGQTMTFKTYSDPGMPQNIVTISPDSDPMFVTSNELVYKDGGEDISTEFTDFEGNTSYLSTYVYEDAQISSTSKMKFDGNGCVISFSDDVPTEYTQGMKYEFAGDMVNLPTTPVDGTGTPLVGSNTYLTMFWKTVDGLITYWNWKSYFAGNRIKNFTSANIPRVTNPTIGRLTDSGKVKEDTDPSSLYAKIEALSTTIASGKSIVGSQYGYNNVVTFRLPKGKYVLPLKNTSSNLKTLKILFSPWVSAGSTSAYLYRINDMYKTSKMTEFDEKGTYYLLMNIPDGGANLDAYHQLSVELLKKPSLMTEQVSIDKIYKYDDDDALFETVFKHIVGDNSTTGLDPNGYYDYAYEVDSNAEIANPLDPDSFNDVDHIFNKFTLCQIGDIDIKVINRLKNG